MRLTIIVHGRPAPQGSHDLGSAGQFLDSSPYLAAWRAAVKAATYHAYAAAGIKPEQLPLFGKGVPVYVEQMTFYVQGDQCRYPDTDEPIGKPDVDKFLRATLDALGGARNPKHHARLFADDSQVKKVCEVGKERSRSGLAGAYIVVSDRRD